ncbi:MAG: 30S ribosome-binding factor RbfA [Bacteroidota bacterium]|nr:30S ribosome-binding factor RbfA [Bacteroidota bacterium]
METTRQKKVSRLLQKELSSVFQKEIPGLLGNVMVSVTLVRVSADLANANVFLSVFPVDDPKNAVKVIKQNSVLFRKKLGYSIKNQLRIVPIVEYFLDDSVAYAEEIDRLLKK